MTDDLTDTEMDMIWAEAEDDAIHGLPRADRYQDNPKKLEFYKYALRQAWFKENH